MTPCSGLSKIAATDFGTSRSRSARAATCHEGAGEAGASCSRLEKCRGAYAAGSEKLNAK